MAQAGRITFKFANDEKYFVKKRERLQLLCGPPVTEHRLRLARCLIIFSSLAPCSVYSKINFKQNRQVEI